MAYIYPTDNFEYPTFEYPTYPHIPNTPTKIPEYGPDVVNELYNKLTKPKKDKIPTVEELKKLELERQTDIVKKAIVKAFDDNQTSIVLDFVIMDDLVDHLRDIGYFVIDKYEQDKPQIFWNYDK